MGLLQVGEQLFPTCGEVPAVGRGWGYSRWESNSSPLVGKSRPSGVPAESKTPWGKRSGMGLLQVVAQLLRPRRMAQLAQRLRFDLADPLSGHPEPLPHLFERPL